MKKKNIWWKCACGKYFQATKREILSGEKRCPRCGARVKLSQEHSGPVPPAGLDETQMVDLREMARMAQTGVDVSVSGEWDTEVVGSTDQKKDQR